MLKVIPTTKEQLIYFMLNNISLGTYDQRFLTNITSLYLSKNNPVTTNQSNLLDKIISRYARQLLKKEISATDAIELPWALKPILSTPEFTDANISVDNDTIILRSPYKADFVKQFKAIPFVKWDRDTKLWSAPLSEQTLKNIVTLTNDHYKTVNYCDTLKSLLDELEPYKDILYWQPTLRLNNNQLVIAAINKSLYEAIHDIELELSLPVIATLSRYGVIIDATVKDALAKQHSTDKIEFACSPFSKIELDPELIVDYITSINADIIIINEGYLFVKSFIEQIIDLLKSTNIHIKVVEKKLFTDENEVKDSKMPVVLTAWSSTESHVKTIHVVNSKPIKLK